MFSWTSRAPSPSTTSAYSIRPASIIIAASCMPLRNPRQALATSKFMHIGGRPSAWCTATAADGSRCARLTELSTSSPTRAGSTPASASAFAPAMAAASAKPTSRGHQRRSVMPARFSSSPGRSPTRR